MEAYMNRLFLGRGARMGVVASLTLATAAIAQMDHDFARLQRQNAQELRQYTWKSRTEIQKGGETRSVQLNLMRYDSRGMLEKTSLSNTPQQQLPTLGLRGFIAGKKKKDLVETLDSLGALARAYSELLPDKMHHFMSTAMARPEMDQQRQLMRVRAIDVLQPGDAMTLWLDALTRKMRRIEVQTALEKKAVRIASDFEDLTNGPT